MITNYVQNQQQLLVKSQPDVAGNIVWVDVVDPTREERLQLEKEYHVSLPQHNEMLQLEYSNRFYEENDVHYLSVNVLVKAAPYPESHVMTFILTDRCLITLRFSQISPITLFASKLQRHQYTIRDHFDVLVLLIQQIAGSVANIFEMVGTSTDMLSVSMMQTIETTLSHDHSRLLNRALREVSKLENVVSKGYHSLSTVTLLLNYFEHTQDPPFQQCHERLHIIHYDVSGLMKYADYLSQKLNFQLQSNLGLINIEQTQIIKIFTVLAMVFMPPTLIASIYGMNFKFMPELNQVYGYPLALILMVMTAYLPYRFFKRRGWI